MPSQARSATSNCPWTLPRTRRAAIAAVVLQAVLGGALLAVWLRGSESSGQSLRENSVPIKVGIFSLSSQQLCGAADPDRAPYIGKSTHSSDSPFRPEIITTNGNDAKLEPWLARVPHACIALNGEELRAPCAPSDSPFSAVAPPFLAVHGPESPECVKVDIEPGTCRLTIPGDTLVLDMYQPHLAHFAESFFALWDAVSRPVEAGLSSDWRLVPFTAEPVPDTHPVKWMEENLALSPGIVSDGVSRLSPRDTASRLPYPRRASLIQLRAQARSGQIPTTGACDDSGLDDAEVCLETLLVRRGTWFQSASAASRYRQHFYDLANRSPIALSAVKRASGVAHQTLLAAEGSRSACSQSPPSDAAALEATVTSAAYACVFIREGRRIVPHTAVVDWFTARGIPTLEIQFLDAILVEQVAAMRLCQILVTPHGAQLTNAVFLPASAAVLELVPWGYRIGGYFETLGTSAGQTWHTYDTTLSESLAQSLPCWNPEWEALGTEGCANNADCSICCKNADMSVSAEKLNELLTKLLASSTVQPNPPLLESK